MHKESHHMVLQLRGDFKKTCQHIYSRERESTCRHTPGSLFLYKPSLNIIHDVEVEKKERERARERERRERQLQHTILGLTVGINCFNTP